MAQEINDNFKVLAQLPIDDRSRKTTIAERDAIESTRRYTGLSCYVEQTSTLYMLVGGITNSDWVSVFTTAGGQIKRETFTYTSPNNTFTLSNNVTTLVDVQIGNGCNFNSYATLANGNEVTIDNSIIFGGESITIIYT